MPATITVMVPVEVVLEERLEQLLEEFPEDKVLRAIGEVISYNIGEYSLWDTEIDAVEEILESEV